MLVNENGWEPIGSIGSQPFSASWGLPGLHAIQRYDARATTMGCVGMEAAGRDHTR